MKTLIKAGLLALFVGGVVAFPAQDAEAITRCREVIRHGHVVKRVCTHAPAYRHRTVCNTYWRHGVRYRSCHRVR